MVAGADAGGAKRKKIHDAGGFHQPEATTGSRTQ